MIEFDFRNIVVLISLAINFLLLWIFYRYGRKTKSGRTYLFAILSIVGWIAPMVFYRAHFFGEVVLWVRILYVMASFTSPTFLLFTLVFPDERDVPIWLQIILFLENLGIILLCFHPTLFITGVQIVDRGEDIILWGPWYAVYAAHISLYFLVGFLILFWKIKRLKGELRKQAVLVLAGYFMGSNLAMITNLVLPWFGYFELNWLGQVCSTILAAFTTYAILKHKLLNIRLIATEAFILILNLFLFIQFVSSDSPRGFTLNGIVMMAVWGISYLLIVNVRKEMHRREEIINLAHSLERANIRLQELDKQKTEFLSIAAHQLRTPLSVLKGYIELITDGAYGKVGVKTVSVLQNMDTSNEHLIKLVDEFLDISRIEQGRTKFAFKDGDLNKVVKDVVNDLTEKAGSQKLQIIWSSNRELGRVYMDEEKIHHVIYNYVDNAIKYSEQGKIEIITERKEDGVEVMVRDQGAGFEKNDEANFFQKFYRGDNVKHMNVNGTGLGLFVCRKFIEAHGGRVWAHSRGLGKGSEFGFWIPLKKK